MSEGEKRLRHGAECPNCKENIAFDLATEFKDGYQLEVRSKLHEGAVLDSEIVVGMVGNTAELLKSIAESHGAKVSVHVAGIGFDEGEFWVKFTVARALQDPDLNAAVRDLLASPDGKGIDKLRAAWEALEGGAE